MPDSRPSPATQAPASPRLEPGGLPDAHLAAIRRYRPERLRQIMRDEGLALLLCCDPINIRYITDARNMQVYALNADCRYVFFAAEGPCVLFDWKSTVDFFRDLPGVDEVRPAISHGFMAEGDAARAADGPGALARWADEIADLVKRHSPDAPRVGVDRLGIRAVSALAARGVEVVDGQPALYRARAVKSAEEVDAIRLAIAACEAGFSRMRERLQPGMTEVELWALLHQANIEWEGEWINARLCTAGPRTNPWMQEASLRPIGRGELVAVDSDLVGPYGYAADISRTWISDGKPTDRQRRLYALAYEHVQTNTELFRPGRSFKEIEAENMALPAAYTDQMFASFAHGLGLCNEWPIIMTAQKRGGGSGGYGGGYDGVLEPGMTMCIESYIGEVGGPDGVKLEQQILVTETGPIPLTHFPFEEDWL
jgi:Xaa-Pro aminopeptidase